jgi:hypothetical protein
MPTKSGSTNCRNSNRDGCKARDAEPVGMLIFIWSRITTPPMKPTKLRPSTAFPVRLILGVDQFFKVRRHSAELAKLAHRKAYNDGVAKGSPGCCFPMHVWMTVSGTQFGVCESR